MLAPERNPFRPPSSDIGTDRPASDPYRWPARFLSAALAVQLGLGVLGSLDRADVLLGALARMLFLLVQVLPPAAALWQLRREATVGVALALLSGSLFMSSHGSDAVWGPSAQILALTILVLAVWVGRSRGLFTTSRA
jgi:hypothetical protein